jgi:hypothetical protein
MGALRRKRGTISNGPQDENDVDKQELKCYNDHNEHVLTILPRVN